MGARQTILDPSLNSPEVREFEIALRQRVVGQDRAVRRLARVYQVFRAGLSTPGRPMVNLLFLGPTGSGKTRLVEATAEVLFGEPRGMIKVDCAEFQHSHEIAKLIGSPPGYIGHRETQPLITQEVLDRHHTEKIKLSLVLFDEIEKASDALWQLLLGILDKGTLTLGDNRRVDFSRTMIFLTSNLGSHEVMNLMNGGLGFAANRGDEDEELDQKIYRAATEAARRKFSPEFMNRIDKVIVFRALTRETSGEDSRHRTYNRATAHHQRHRRTAIFVSLHDGGAGLPTARRHRHQVWGAPPEAFHRASSGLPHLEPARHRADSAWRPHHRGF